jgi:hypothetical protein
MRRHFSDGRHGAIGSNPQPAMHKQERRQGARNKENIIEPRVKKTKWQCGFISQRLAAYNPQQTRNSGSKTYPNRLTTMPG